MNDLDKIDKIGIINVFLGNHLKLHWKYGLLINKFFILSVIWVNIIVLHIKAIK